MMVTLFIVAQFFATLVLLMTFFGSVQNHNLPITGQMLLSVAVSLAFIVLITLLSLAHPWMYGFYGFATVVAILFIMRPDKSSIFYAGALSLMCLLFWAHMVAMFIFNLMFIVPKELQGGKDEDDD